MPTHPLARAAATLLLSALTLTVSAENRALGTDEVGTLLAGNTLQGESQLERFRDRPDRHFQIYLHPAGTLVVRNFEGDTDTGRWTVTDEGLFCNQYRHTRRGMRKCYAVEPRDGGFALRDSGTGRISTLFTVREGAAEWLEGGNPTE